ncbi:unnamed protein product, partial [Ectocarpus sp. 4 AP-2014]
SNSPASLNKPTKQKKVHIYLYSAIVLLIVLDSPSIPIQMYILGRNVHARLIQEGTRSIYQTLQLAAYNIRPRFRWFDVQSTLVLTVHHRYSLRPRHDRGHISKT